MSEQGLRLQNVGVCSLRVGGALVDFRLRDVLIAYEVLAALQLQIRVYLCRFRPGKIGGLLVDRCLLGIRFDAEKQIAGLDLLPFGEIAFVDETRSPGDHIDFVDRHDAADETGGLGHLAAGRRNHGHCRRRRRSLRDRRT